LRGELPSKSDGAFPCRINFLSQCNDVSGSNAANLTVRPFGFEAKLSNEAPVDLFMCPNVVDKTISLVGKGAQSVKKFL
jgi:hypothetical protein